MSRPAPLQAYVYQSCGDGKFFAALYCPARKHVLLEAAGPDREAALDLLLRKKRYSRVARRRYVVKSARLEPALYLPAGSVP